MPHITLFQEIGRQEGLQEGRQEATLETMHEAILDVLDARFGPVPEAVRQRVHALDDELTLKDLLRRAVRVPSLEEFRSTL